jgi:hypothetical protein
MSIFTKTKRDIADSRRQMGLLTSATEKYAEALGKVNRIIVVSAEISNKNQEKSSLVRAPNPGGIVLDSSGNPISTISSGSVSSSISSGGGSAGGGSRLVGIDSQNKDRPTTPGSYLGEIRGEWRWMLSQNGYYDWVRFRNISSRGQGGTGSSGSSRTPFDYAPSYSYVGAYGAGGGGDPSYDPGKSLTSDKSSVAGNNVERAVYNTGTAIVRAISNLERKIEKNDLRRQKL